MSYPDRNNPYNFDDFLQWRENVDYYADDPFAQAVVRTFCGDMADEVDAAAREMSKKASFKWRKLADEIAWPEKRPYMQHYDGHNNRIDRIMRPMETEVLEREVFGEALFSKKTHPWVRLIKMFLIYQNGEACISCPLTCTEGLVSVMEPHADTPEVKAVLEHCKEGVDGEFAIGAQYLSEIQGGSDVPSNLLEAVQEDGVWKLYGTKFFCSATHADYAMVTAKPKGSEKVGLFVMPSWLPGDKQRQRRNGFIIDRIKWKMGTSELTTAEITIDGAVAYQVGPLERGLANMVGVVLTYSRLTVGLSGAASMTRAWREAAEYCRFRDAFGVPHRGLPHGGGPAGRYRALGQADPGRGLPPLQGSAGPARRIHRRRRRRRRRGHEKATLPGARVGDVAKDRHQLGLPGRGAGGHESVRRPRRDGGLLLPAQALPRRGGQRTVGRPPATCC